MVLAVLPLAGCLVPRVDYRAEISRGRALEHDLELAEAQSGELQLQIRHLERTGQNLELERSSLDEERLKLLNELEDMHQGNVSLYDELIREREIREKREAEIAEISGTYRSLVDALEQEVEPLVVVIEVEGRAGQLGLIRVAENPIQPVARGGERRGQGDQNGQDP